MAATNTSIESPHVSSSPYNLSESFFCRSPFNQVDFDNSYESYKQKKRGSILISRSYSPIKEDVDSPPLSPIKESHFLEPPQSPCPKLSKSPLKDFTTPVKPSVLKVSPKKIDLNHTLCVSMILEEIGMMKYNEIFIREEIDLVVFFTLTVEDMHMIGIFDPKDIKTILDAKKQFQFLKG